MQDAAYQIAIWLAKQVQADGFPARTFYGEGFALWLWQFFPGEFESVSRQMRPIAQQQLERQDIAAHPEFNTWAILHFCEKANQSPCQMLPALPQLNNTPNSNWLLLGTLVRLLWATQTGNQVNNGRLRRHTRLLLAAQQQRDGLIRDDRLISRQLPLPFPYGRSAPYRLKKMAHLQKLSLQYHCFSLLLLQEIWQLTGWKFVQTAVQRGHQAMGRFILSNGDSLYIGRGQQQIFGYGSLLYFLATQANAGNQEAMAQTNQVWQFVRQFQQTDGRFPLVLRTGENGYPKVIDTHDPRWLGWYRYNNLFDYLPFLGVQLARAAQLVANINPSAAAPTTRSAVEVTSKFAFVRQSSWQMTLAAPGGDNSQDQPMPYLCLQGKSILPCFGGEAGDDQLYQLSTLPLPYLQLDNGRFQFLRAIMRWRLKAPIQNQSILLTGRGRAGKMMRIFSWKAQEIVIQDILTLKPAKLPTNVQTIYPLVFTAFELVKLNNGRFQIKPAPFPVFLTAAGQQGSLEIIKGYTPVGVVQVLREPMAWQKQRRRTAVFQRTYRLTWTESR